MVDRLRMHQLRISPGSERFHDEEVELSRRQVQTTLHSRLASTQTPQLATAFGWHRGRVVSLEFVRIKTCTVADAYNLGDFHRGGIASRPSFVARKAARADFGWLTAPASRAGSNSTIVRQHIAIRLAPIFGVLRGRPPDLARETQRPSIEEGLSYR